MYCMIHSQNPVCYHKFRHALVRHIQPHCDIFRTLCNSCIFRTMPYSESWDIQNLRYIQNSVKAYSGIFRKMCISCILRALPYSELCHIQTFATFRTPGIFRILFIQTHSGIFHNNSFNTINFLFSMTSIQCSIFQNNVIIEYIKLTFSLENKFYDRKKIIALG